MTQQADGANEVILISPIWFWVLGTCDERCGPRTDWTACQGAALVHGCLHEFDSFGTVGTLTNIIDNGKSCPSSSDLLSWAAD